MTTAIQAGHAALQGWRAKVADGVAKPVAKRSPLSEDQVRAAVGALFFLLSVLYIAKTIRALVRESK
jgi:hypothetical protein